MTMQGDVAADDLDQAVRRGAACRHKCPLVIGKPPQNGINSLFLCVILTSA